MELRRLRAPRANEILKTAAVLFALVREAELEESYPLNEIVDLYRRNKCVYGVRMMWHAAGRAGRDQMGR